ncbi:ABC transporter substrate-binding protein, partial [Paenibacillus polymyxa]|uniref:ABC transporter substrate-binding protein n=1 Tax=Paenibacillus polymyxa TaxID=1406 RepID=UPI0006BFD2B7
MTFTKKRKQRMSILIAVMVITALLAGCGGGSGNSAQKANGEDDKSQKVQLQFYMLGDAPKDLSTIEAEINKLAEKDLNATVKFNYTTWTDWDQKYKLLLSSGQPIDLIFTADWTQYQAYAKKGAFLPLDDLLPKAAPALQKFVPQDMWDGVKIGGKIYTVPGTYKEYVTNGFVWREDLREKYNLPKPTDIKSYEAYMDGIRQHEPNMKTVSLNSDIKGNLHDRYTELVTKSVGALPYG